MRSQSMQRFYDVEGDYVSIDLLMDWVRAHPLRSGRILPIIIWGGFGIGKCVRADTQIDIDGQTMSIEEGWDLFVEDTLPDPDGGVWGICEKMETSSFCKGEVVSGRIEHFFRQRICEWGRRVSLRSGEEIVMTQRHRLLTDKGWCRDIVPGDMIYCADHRSCADTLTRVRASAVDSVELVFLDEWVYDLEVDRYHNYIANGIITHNTQSIKAYGESRGLDVRTYHPAHDVNGADIVGRSYRETSSNETRYALPSWLPTEDDPPEGVLFIDELNRAPEEVLAGLMEPLGEGTIAQSGWKLPEGWNIIAAANPSEMGYMVQDLDEAMIDRMLHYAPGWDARHWGRWASDSGLSDEIINFALQHQNGLVVTGESQLPLEIETKLRTTPRTLEYMDALYEPGMPEGLLRVCSQGLMGREASEVYRSLLQQESPLEPEQILSEPVLDAAGAPQYLYEDKVRKWSVDAIEGEGLIRASSELMVIDLLRSPPVSSDPKQERRGALAGRYLAFIPPHLREAALQSIKRSAPGWLPVIETAVLGWSEVLARQQKIFSQREVHGQAQLPEAKTGT